MGLAFFSPSFRSGSRSLSSVGLALETLEDRCVPSATMIQSMMLTAPQPATNTMATNAIAALPHDEIHVLQDQVHQQAALATFTLRAEQIVLSLLQPIAPQFPQLMPFINALNSAIPTQEARAAQLQNQSDLLDQLDSLQDQVIILNAEIQNDMLAVPVLQRLGATPAAAGLLNTIAQDQITVQALQPQITLAEQEVATFLP